MKQYFIDKLSAIVTRIDSVKESIIKNVQDLKVGELVALSNRLTTLLEEHSQLTKDCIMYCSVADVIEIGSATKKYSNNEPLNLLDKNSILYAYKYNIKKPITLAERDQLVAKFGYNLKEAKV